MCKSCTGRSPEMQAKKRMGNYSNALPVSEDILYCLHYRANLQFVLLIYRLSMLCWSAGSLKHIQHDSQ